MRKTKIIATVGPASISVPILTRIIEEGADYIRLNTAYGDLEQYDLLLNNLKVADSSKQIEVIFDIKTHDVLDYAVKNGIKKIAISFAESANQVSEVKKLVPGAFVISKIESKNGINNFAEILSVSEGVMVARGDLGEAVALEKIPPLQHQMTLKTLEANKFLITATEMLLSMVNSYEPSRAEVSDVANAVFDYSSAVMLSEETAIGKFPVESVIMMRKIIEEAESYMQNNCIPRC